MNRPATSHVLARHSRASRLRKSRESVSVGLEPAATNACQLAGSAVCECAARQFQQLDCRTSNTGAEAPSPVCRRRAESPSPGGGPGRALPSIPARAAPQLRTAGRNEQTSCQSRRAAARPAARKQLLLPPRCRRASTSSRASARARLPSRSRAQTSLPTAALARCGAFSNTKNNNV